MGEYIARTREGQRESWSIKRHAPRPEASASTRRRKKRWRSCVYIRSAAHKRERERGSERERQRSDERKSEYTSGIPSSRRGRVRAHCVHLSVFLSLTSRSRLADFSAPAAGRSVRAPSTSWPAAAVYLAVAHTQRAR